MTNYLISLPSNHNYAKNHQIKISQPILHPQTLLSILSTALKRSLQIYTYGFIQFNSPKKLSKTKKITKKEKKIVCIEIQSNENEQQQSKTVSDDKQKIIPSEKAKDDLHKSDITSGKLTNQDRLTGRTDVSSIELQNVSVRISVKKQKIKDQKSQFVAVVPQVDLIDHAYIGQTKLNNIEIQRIRENLMNRKIDDWTTLVKFKKDKRQVQNLRR